MTYCIFRCHDFSSHEEYLNAFMQQLMFNITGEQQEQWYIKSTVVRYHDAFWVNRVLQKLYNISEISSSVFHHSEMQQIRCSDQTSLSHNQSLWNVFTSSQNSEISPSVFHSRIWQTRHNDQLSATSSSNNQPLQNAYASLIEILWRITWCAQSNNQSSAYLTLPAQSNDQFSWNVSITSSWDIPPVCCLIISGDFPGDSVEEQLTDLETQLTDLESWLTDIENLMRQLINLAHSDSAWTELI